MTKPFCRVMSTFLKGDIEFSKQFSNNESFRRWRANAVFVITYYAADQASRDSSNSTLAPGWWP